MNINKQRGYALYELVLVIIYILAAVGYIMNLVKILSGGIPDPMSIEMIVRVAGLIIAPIGIIMGFIPLGY